MPLSPRMPRLLAAARAAVKELGTNPYQIAKATGLSVGSVQNLLSDKVSPSLQNIEEVLRVLGLEIQVVRTSSPLVKAGVRRARVAARKRPAKPSS